MNNQHHYYSLDEYLRKTYNSKVFKVSLNGDFSCPNRDGKISSGGCIFCSAKGSGDFAGEKSDPLEVQFKEVKDIISLKWPNSKYIAYFQANTNTYAPLEKLKALYEKAITLDEGIVALSIATRPDCLSESTINYLGELNERIPVWIELGLQTISDKTAQIINRGYKTEVFYKAVEKLRSKDITVIVHIINGLPGEDKEDMLNTVREVNKLDIQGIKLHSLCILKNTKLAEMYQEGLVKPLSLEEYVDIAASEIELIRDDIVIHRIGADAPLDLLIEPQWTRKKFVVMNEIDKYMREHNIYQGQKKL